MSPHPMLRLNPQGSDARSALGTAALLLIPVACCAGPALLGAATLTAALAAVGAWLLNPWLLGAAGALTLAALGWRLRPRATSSLRPAGCLPDHPAQSVATDRSPIPHQER